MMRFVAFLLLLGLWAGEARAQAPESVTFGLDWTAEAEYGGFYQALATGLYAKHHLDVHIRQGGPQVNQAQLLLAGKLDFNLSSNSFLALNFVEQKLPFVAIAAMYQKDPSVLIAHPGQGNDSFAALRGKPIMIGADTRAGWWNYLRARFGYTDSQIRPYDFDIAPFLHDPKAIQEGYLGSEPYSIKQATGQYPVVLLIADAGFDGYGSLISTSRKLIAAKPALVQRFVDASIEGWYSYLYGDPTPANTLIKKDNPEMTDALLAYGRGALIAHGIVDSGAALQSGIGAMNATRWASFTRTMVTQKLYPASLDPAKAYTLRFVNKKVGMTMKPAGQ